MVQNTIWKWLNFFYGQLFREKSYKCVNVTEHTDNAGTKYKR